MKYAATAALCVVLLACQSHTQQTSKLKNQKDSLSYSIGVNIGKSFKQQSIDVDPNLLTQGIKDEIAGGKMMLTEDEAQAVLATFQKEMVAKHDETTKAVAEKNKNDGSAFLVENKKKDGIVTLPSGLQYKVLAMGTGKKPKATETVSVNYRGTLIDGTEFDNSYKRGQPATFEVNGVIKGWTEALQLMPVGSKWQLFVSSDLAYGERGAGQVIPPNATLIFEVELLSISEKKSR